MAFLGPIEVVRVAGMRPDVRALLTQLMAAFEKRTGMQTFVPADGGVRTNTRQAAIFADSLSEGFRASPAGSSFHEYGAAFDLNVVGHTTGDADADKRSEPYRLLAEEARKLGLRCGYDFKSGKPDPYHFEMNETLADAAEKWDALNRGRL